MQQQQMMMMQQQAAAVRGLRDVPILVESIVLLRLIITVLFQ